MADDRHPSPAAPALEALRQEFDRSFARPPVDDAGEMEQFVAIRLGADRYALALRDIAGLEPGKRVVPLPAA